MLKKLAKIVLKKGLPEGIDLLNLNVPSEPVSDEIKIVRLGNRMYTPIIQSRVDPRGKPYYWTGGIPYNGDTKGTDSYCLKKEHVTTLTPLTIDLTANLNELKKWIK